ncbi:MAG TPA: hypothetical protein VIK77_05795 [Tissierellaceae bacterium]
MTLFELLNSDERLIMFSKVKLEIYSISSRSYLADVLISDIKFIRDILDLDDIPYHLLSKKVVKTIFYENVIRIYVK